MKTSYQTGDIDKTANLYKTSYSNMLTKHTNNLPSPQLSTAVIINLLKSFKFKVPKVNLATHVNSGVGKAINMVKRGGEFANRSHVAFVA